MKVVLVLIVGYIAYAYIVAPILGLDLLCVF